MVWMVDSEGPYQWLVTVLSALRKYHLYRYLDQLGRLDQLDGGFIHRVWKVNGRYPNLYFKSQGIGIDIDIYIYIPPTPDL